MHVIGWRRLFSALLGLWFTAYAAEPAALVACPMHGATPVAAGHAPHGGAKAPADASGHAGAQPAPAATHAPEHSHDPGRHNCTCIGHCCASSVAVVRADDSRCPVAALAAVARVAVPRAAHRVPAPADYTLPFATAPPLA
jgi:hypothetical protein